MRLLAAVAVLSAGCRLGFEPEARHDAGAVTSDADAGGASSDGASDGSSADSVSFTCPQAYASIAGTTSKYRFISTSEVWLAAESACEADGWHLAIPDGVVELNILADAAPGTNLWIGVTDRLAVGSWETVTGSTATYLPWEASEPDASAAECVQLVPTFEIADQDCTSGRRAFCECDGLAADPSSY